VKHTYKILVFLLTLAMLFTMTVMAAEPEVETCEEGCVHAHEEDAAGPAALDWECSSHNIRIYNERRITNVTSTTHSYRYVSIEECTNSGCSYRMEYPGATEYTEAHDGAVCSICFHVSSRQKTNP